MAETTTSYSDARSRLQRWIQERDYAGFEPYDLLNSEYLHGGWARQQPFASVLLQTGKHYGGLTLRRWLRVPASKNPKALGLILSAYCDLKRLGEDTALYATYLKAELRRLRSPQERDYCWGYDWDWIALRGTRLSAFSPNCIATYFCASALLDMANCFADSEAHAMALSAASFVTQRLNRSVDGSRHLCFSYTPRDHTLIFNNSVLAGALLARLAGDERRIFHDLARRSIQYLADHQASDGSWPYGTGPLQHWIDGFHTGYNLCAILEYRHWTGDQTFDETWARAYRFYKMNFFREDGAPKYMYNRLYPIDIHACTQAILTFCASRQFDHEAMSLARRTADWTLANMQNDDGTFGFQIRRFRTDRTPYMRWGQAWMLRALARLELELNNSGGVRTP